MRIPRSFISILTTMFAQVPSQHHDVPYLVRSQGITHKHVRVTWETQNRVILCVYGRSLVNIEYVSDESNKGTHRISRIVPLRLPSLQEIRTIGSGHVRSMYRLFACEDPILFRMFRCKTDPESTIRLEISYDGKIFHIELLQEGEDRDGDVVTYALS